MEDAATPREDLEASLVEGKDHKAALSEAHNDSIGDGSPNPNP